MTKDKTKTAKGTFVKLTGTDETRLEEHEQHIAERLQRDFPDMEIKLPSRKLVLESLIRFALDRSEAERGGR